MDKLTFEKIKEALDLFGDYVARETRFSTITLIDEITNESIEYNFDNN